jgi:N-acetylglutamate synthase-like GNAT family acetyltransferase
MIIIDNFYPEEQRKIKDFILAIQNNEFHLDFSEHDQPDLIDTNTFYEGGGFWTAKWEGVIVGTIGLQKLDAFNGVLRKLFVKNEFRGRPFEIAQKLFDLLLDTATKAGLTEIWLDTPEVAKASHKFYERNGFRQTNPANLPVGYSFLDKNSKIYKLVIV